jgi:hypothetical protein
MGQTGTWAIPHYRRLGQPRLDAIPVCHLQHLLGLLCRSRYASGQQQLGSRHPHGTSVAGCSREAWPFRLMLMRPQENAGLVSFLADYDLPICRTETG